MRACEKTYLSFCVFVSRLLSLFNALQAHDQIWSRVTGKILPPFHSLYLIPQRRATKSAENILIQFGFYPIQKSMDSTFYLSYKGACLHGVYDQYRVYLLPVLYRAAAKSRWILRNAAIMMSAMYRPAVLENYYKLLLNVIRFYSWQ